MWLGDDPRDPHQRIRISQVETGWVGQVYSAPGNGTSRVSTLISKRISFQLIKQISDTDGRYLIRFCLLQNEKCILVNIYAPNTGQSTFLSKLHLLLAEFADYPILMAGDFNLVSNAVVDRSGLISDIYLIMLPSALFVPNVTNSKTKQWRFNNSLLREQDFVSVIEERTQEFFSNNFTSDVSIQTVWEAYKATCRGGL